MANGDLASSSGLFTPVSAGAEYRLGYDDINRLADVVARNAGGAAWSLSAITPSTGWGTLTDPNGTTGAGAQGGVKLIGLQVAASFCLTYTGSTQTVGTNGEIVDQTIATLSSTYRPAAFRWLRGYTRASSFSLRVSGSGAIVLTDGTPNTTLFNGLTVQIEGAFQL